MPILLPLDPLPTSMGIATVSAKNTLTPAIGGAEQELLRKGTRYELTFDMGELDYADALAWADLDVEGDTVVMPVYQPGLEIGAPGAPLVNGSGHAGSSLPIKGLAAGYPVRKGQFLTHLTAGGQRFLYRARAAVTANSSGVATVPLYTLLRRPPVNSEVIEILQPKVEGFVRDYAGLTIVSSNDVALKFKIRERE